MWGFGVDDVAFMVLGALGLALLGAIATSNRNICDKLNDVAQKCREYHDKNRTPDKE